MFIRTWSLLAAMLLVSPADIAIAQTDDAPPVEETAGSHQHADHQMTMSGGAWHFMQEGVVFAMVNHQGGPRGGDEFRAPNWWMGMWRHGAGRSELSFNAMFSLDPATVGKRGYKELLQVGEAIGGAPLVDHQHPHDLFMQLSATWRRSLTDTMGLTIAGGPVGE